MNTEKKDRRSFLVDLLSSVAGIWATVTGLGLLLPRRAEAEPRGEGCEDETGLADKQGRKQIKTKYGGRPRKYGGRPHRPKYGGPTPPKYGGKKPPPGKKYGGPPPPGPKPKYGGRRPRPLPPGRKSPKYGGPTPPDRE